jgi:hypothetical protein
LRTLLRLRHDLVMIGRAAQVPLPEVFQARLASPLAKIASAAAEHLAASARALRARRGPSPLNPVDAELDAYVAEVTALRGEGLTRGLAAEAAERFFALGFALEQVRLNLKDLDRCVTEWAEEAKPRK